MIHKHILVVGFQLTLICSSEMSPTKTKHQRTNNTFADIDQWAEGIQMSRLEYLICIGVDENRTVCVDVWLDLVKLQRILKSIANGLQINQIKHIVLKIKSE